tara:strand:- start:10713 stop:11654 length:942 start_codon:yes stop_codon:yes gene_type:complete
MSFLNNNLFVSNISKSYDVLKIEITEKNNSLLPFNLDYIKNFHGRFIPVLNSESKIISLPYFIKLDEKFLLLNPSITTENVLEHLCCNRDNELSSLLIEGINSHELVNKIFKEELREININSVVEFEIDEKTFYVIRRGLLGESGFLCITREIGFLINLIKDLDYNINDIDLIKEDALVLSQEKGGFFWGSLFSGNCCPYESNLGYLLDLDNDQFIYLDNLKINHKSSLYRSVGFIIPELSKKEEFQNLISVGDSVFLNGKEIGEIKKVNFSESLGIVFGFANVLMDYSYPSLSFQTERGVLLLTKSIPFKVQ